MYVVDIQKAPITHNIFYILAVSATVYMYVCNAQRYKVVFGLQYPTNNNNYIFAKQTEIKNIYTLIHLLLWDTHTT